MEVKIHDYEKESELSWLDVHASVMVDSYAWWTVIHKKPVYENEAIDLVATINDSIVGFITIEINSEVLEMKNYGFVWEFGVHRNYRGKNIGNMLIQEAHKILNNNYNINKSVWYSQDERAQKYYEKLGMKEIARHWQFSIYPRQDLKKMLLNEGLNVWNIRGSSSVEDFEGIKRNFDVITDDDALSPKLCIGYEYIL